MTEPDIDAYRTKRWYKIFTVGISDSFGTKRWYNCEKLHREDGPAVVYPFGTKEWYIKGDLHREDGPAIEYNDGTKRWWINGNEITNTVEQWIKDNNFPEYKQWTDSIKVMFKLTFG